MHPRVGPSRATGPVVVATTVPASAQLFCGPLMRALLDQGDEVVLVTSPGEASRPLPETLHGAAVQGLPMHREPAPGPDLVALARWVRLLARLRPRAVVAMTPKASLLGLLAARLTGVPVRTYLLLGLRLEGAHGARARILEQVERVTSGSATHVVANSPSLARAYADRRLDPRGRLQHTRPGSDHGVDAEHFDPGRPVPELELPVAFEGRVVIGFVGRVAEDKGVAGLAAAVTDPRLRERVALLVVGPEESAPARRALEVAGEQVPVLLAGPLDDPRPAYAAMDVLALPTRREGFPNVVLEAAAMGVPTVTTTATGAVDAVMPGGTGLLVDVDDPAALADALARLVDDPSLRARLGEAAQARARTDFAPAAIARQVLSLGGLARVASPVPRGGR